MTTKAKIDIIEIALDKSRSKFNTFIHAYKEQQNELCIYKGEQTQSLFKEMPEDFKDAQLINENDKIIYIYNQEILGKINKKILAFALIRYKDENIIELVLLCSRNSTNEKRRTKRLTNVGEDEYTTLGVYLLDYIYINLLDDRTILLIQPATRDLIPYYVKWKTPSLPIELFKLKMTSGYLIYCKEEDFNKLMQIIWISGYIYDFNALKSIRKHLNLTDFEINELNGLDLEEYKSKLLIKIDDFNDSGEFKLQIRIWVDNIHVRNLDEFKLFVQLNATTSGGKYKRKINKRRKNKNTKKQNVVSRFKYSLKDRL